MIISSKYYVLLITIYSRITWNRQNSIDPKNYPRFLKKIVKAISSKHSTCMHSSCQPPKHPPRLDTTWNVTQFLMYICVLVMILNS